MKALAALLLVLCFQLAAIAQNMGTLPGKNTAYFHDLYGKPQRTTEVTAAKFTTPEVQGAGPIKGPFSLRTYKADKLRIEVYYLLPKLEAVYVRYSLPHQWTEEQVTTALSAYGTSWKRDGGQVLQIFPYYKAESGARAYHMASQLSFLSEGLIQTLRDSAQAADEKRKEVPKF